MLAFFMAGVTLTGHAQIKNRKGVPITAAAVDQFLKKQMDSLKIPALSIALISDGQLVYHRAWGVADLDTREPVNDSSLFAVEPTDQDTIYSHSGENPGFLAFCAFSRKQKNGYVFFTNGDQGGILNMRLRVFLNEYKDSGLY